MIGALGEVPCGLAASCVPLSKMPGSPFQELLVESTIEKLQLILKFNGTFSGRDALTYQTLSLGVKY